ncbi:MAG: metallophosphoesterase family protein [Gemmobacter sp.]
MAAAGPFRLAIVADTHFHDPHGEFGGAGSMVDGERLVLRSWRDTRGGIRAVNESATALTAALDRIVALGLRHVVLAGDYSDDGQAETVRRLAILLHCYQDRHGLRFHAIPGNHDVHAAQGKHTSARIVTGPGQTALLTSDPTLDGHVTPAMRCLGQPEGLRPMAAFGLFRQADHLHWESPFGPDDAPQARMYDATAADGTVAHRLMDASYLVEPEAGLWLLMLDANVYEPRPGRRDPARKKAFLDPSEAGWNALLRVKPHLLRWIADVTARAAAQGKVLVTVSHYPVLDPFLPAAGAEAALTPASSLAIRTPGPAVAQALIGAGLRWHAGGHLHVHATNTLRTAEGTLTDVALPSLVTHPPAFTEVTAGHDGTATRAHSLADLPPDPVLTALYAAEGRTDPPMDYGDFLAEQFRTRVREVRLPRDWPQEVLDWSRGRHAGDLIDMLGGKTSALTAADMADYSLFDLAADIHLLREGGSLAVAHIFPDRLALCHALCRHGDPAADPGASVAGFWRRFLSVLPDV